MLIKSLGTEIYESIQACHTIRMKCGDYILLRICIIIVAIFAPTQVNSCLANGTQHKRNMFIGHTDLKGYRCHFTFASDWQSVDDTDQRNGPIDGLIDHVTFIPKNPSHRPASDLAEVYLQTFTKDLLPGDVPILKGYPEPALLGKDRVQVHRHLRIDGYPATIISTDWAEDGMRRRETEFYVYVAARSVLYIIHTNPECANFSKINHEMQAMIASFHIDKAAVPTNKKL